MTTTAPYRPAVLERWKPKKWEPFHEQIVALSCMGRSNKEIAETFGYTPQHISNIINTPQAALVRRRILTNLQEKVDAGIPRRLGDLADKATQRVAQVLFDDNLFERSPFAVVDRSLAVLRGVGKLKTVSEMEGGNKTNNTIIFTSEDAADIRAGLAKAREASERHPVELPTTAKELKSA